MTFKIDEGLKQIGALAKGSKPKLRTASQEQDASLVQLTSSTDETLSKAELETYNKPVTATGDRFDLGYLKKYAEIAQNATNNLEAIAQQRVELARKAEALPEISDYANDLEAEDENLSNEQTRILNTAVFNGNSVSSSATLRYDVKSEESYSSITIPGISSSTNPSTDLYTSALAATAVDTLEAARDALQSLDGATESAVKAASALSTSETESTSEATKAQPDSDQATAQVKKLANQVASKLSEAYGDSQATEDLINAATKGLNPDRVKDLLS